jgi:hypothetical protein
MDSTPPEKEEKIGVVAVIAGSLPVVDEHESHHDDDDGNPSSTSNVTLTKGDNNNNNSYLFTNGVPTRLLLGTPHPALASQGSKEEEASSR